jgi:hypothetical protein
MNLFRIVHQESLYFPLVTPRVGSSMKEVSQLHYESFMKFLSSRTRGEPITGSQHALVWRKQNSTTEGTYPGV